MSPVLIVAEFLRCFSLISIVQNTTSFTPKPAPIPCYWYGPVLCCKSVPPRRDEIRDVHFWGVLLIELGPESHLKGETDEIQI